MITRGVAEWLGSEVEGLAYSETTNEGNVFVDAMPNAPSRAVCVYTALSPASDSKLPYSNDAFQLVVRCEAGSNWARVMTQALFNRLQAARYFTLPDGTRIVYILEQTSWFRIGPDSSGRPSFSAAYRAETVTPTAERPE